MEQWCGETAGIPPLGLVGAFANHQIPEGLYGMIGALLLRSSVMGEDIQDELLHLDFALPDAPFRVVLLALDSDAMPSLTGRARHNCRLNVYFALEKHMTQALSETCRGFFVLQMGYLIGLLYPGETDCIPQVCRSAVEFGKAQGFRLHANISMRRTGVTFIETSYIMVENFEKSRRFFAGETPAVFELPENVLSRMEDSDQRTNFEQTFFKSTDQICGAVRAEDAATAAQYLRDQLSKIADNCLGLPFPMAMNMTVNRFVTLLQYRLVDQSLADWRYLSAKDFSRELASAPTMVEFLSLADRISQDLVAHCHARTTLRHDSLMHDIRAFVESNATDMNMGLTAVAREFKLRPREAAESFRQYFGESVNDVMHRSRVRKAKELLLTTDASVQEIAQQVGYCSLATMYRAFTNVEGIAPGKLRQNK